MTGRTDHGRWRRLDLTVGRRVDGLLQGDQEGLRLGPGGDREELTRYQPGDDPRQIDWNVTARSTDLHVWRTRAEHELDTWVLLDQSASMAFGTGDLEKRDVALEVAAAVGLLTDAPGNRVGLAHLDSTGLTWSRPTSGRVAARALLADSESESGTAHRTGTPPVGLAEALAALRRRAPRAGLRVVLSDLLDGDPAAPDWERPLRYLAGRHDVLVVQIADPREFTLPAVGHLVLVDPETGAQREVWTGDRGLRRRYAAAATARHEALRATVRRTGADHLVLRTDDDWTVALTAHLRARRRVTRRPCRRTS